MKSFILIFTLFSLSIGILSSAIYNHGLKLSKEALESVLTGMSLILLFQAVTDWRIRYYGTSQTVEILHRLLAHISVYLFYLAICSFILSMIFAIAHLGNISINTILLSKITIVLSCTLATIGIIQSYTLKTTYYSFSKKIKEKQFKIALTSDQHFGVINQTLLGNRLIAKLRSEKPDLIVIAGDLFDGPQFNIESVKPILKEIHSIAPVIYTSGNHEEYGEFNSFIQNTIDAGFKVLNNKFVNINGIMFGGYDYTTSEQASFHSIIDNDKEIIKDAIIILHKPDPKNIEYIAKYQPRFILSGHTHNGQMFPINIPVSFVYGKYTYGVNSLGKTSTITTSGVGTARMPVRLFNTPEIAIIDIK